MKRVKTKGDGIDRYWRTGCAVLYIFGIGQLAMAFMTTSIPFLSQVFLFGSLSISGAASLIISLNKRVEKLEEALERFEERLQPATEAAPP